MILYRKSIKKNCIRLYYRLLKYAFRNCNNYLFTIFKIKYDSTVRNDTITNNFTL